MIDDNEAGKNDCEMAAPRLCSDAHHQFVRCHFERPSRVRIRTKELSGGLSGGGCRVVAYARCSSLEA